MSNDGDVFAKGDALATSDGPATGYRDVFASEQFHHRAMDLAAQAVRAVGAGDQEKAQQLLVKAFRNEAMAANIVASLEDSEPTRSVLHRSAASLAANADMYHEAVRYAEAGLAGADVPPGIQEELKHVLMLARGALVAESQARGDHNPTEPREESDASAD